MPAPRVVDDKIQAKVVHLYRDQELPIMAIQQRFGLSHQIVMRILNAAGVEARGRHQSRRRFFL